MRNRELSEGGAAQSRAVSLKGQFVRFGGGGGAREKSP